MKNKKAFTLIELIVSLAIISFLVLILSNLFSFNIKFLTDSHNKEKEYKEAYTGFLYIEETIRRSYRIDEKEFDGFTNFTGEVDTFDGDRSFYEFFIKNDETNPYLAIKRRNLDKNTSDRDGINKIARCKDIKLIYNKEKNLISLSLKSLYDTYDFKTTINLGEKL